MRQSWARKLVDPQWSSDVIGTVLVAIVCLSEHEKRGREFCWNVLANTGALMWYRTRGAVSRSMCIIFGFTEAVTFRWLQFEKIILLCTFQKPTSAEVCSYCNAITSQYHHAQDVWAVWDGHKLSIEAAMDDATQSIFGNGWTHGHYLRSCIFVFSPPDHQEWKDLHLLLFQLSTRMLAWLYTGVSRWSLRQNWGSLLQCNRCKLVVAIGFLLGNRGYFIKISQL